MRRALLVALFASVVAAVVVFFLPDPATTEDPPPPPRPPEAPAEVAFEDVDMEWKTAFREALAGADKEGGAKEVEAAPHSRRMATVVPDAPVPTPTPEELPPPPPLPEAPAAPAAPPRQQLDNASVIKAMKWMQPEIAECYQEGLKRDKDLEGTVWVGFTMEVSKQEGRVLEPRIVPGQNSMKQGYVQGCLLEALAKAHFPAPGVESARVKVRYPFTLRTKSQTPF